MTTDLSDLPNSPIPGITDDPDSAPIKVALTKATTEMVPAALDLQNVGEIDRRTYIGGSRVSAILGLDPYGKTPLTEYEKIIGEVTKGPDAATLEFFEWRKEWEPVVIKRIKRQFKTEIVGENRRFIDKEHDFFAAEIDFEWVDENGEIQNGEIKTVHPIAFSESAGWGEEGTDQAPIHYAAQCMWGLGVTGRRVCILVAMAGIDKFVFYRIERDEETIAGMREECRKFWVENVLAQLPPDPINMADMARIYTKLKGRPVELDEPTLKALRDLQAARDMAKSSELAVEELTFRVADFVRKAWQLPPAPPKDAAETEENAELRFNGQKVGTWNKQPHSHLDQTRLGEEMPEIKKQYTKTKTIRVMRVTKPKKG